MEPIEFLADQPNGKFAGTRDVVIADLTLFNSVAELNGDDGHDPLRLTRVRISGRGLTDDLRGEEGEQLCFGLQMKPSDKGNPFAVWRELDEAITEKVDAWLTNRESAFAAAMAADLPDDLL